MAIRPFIIGLDWDDTCTKGEWGGDQALNLSVIWKAIRFQEAGALVVLWTCREGEGLQKAIDLAKGEGLIFDAHNENVPLVDIWNRLHGVEFAGRKIFCDLYVDDKSPGSIDYFLERSIVGEYEDGFIEEGKTYQELADINDLLENTTSKED